MCLNETYSVQANLFDAFQIQDSLQQANALLQ
jgi:hypothetical protein